MSSSNTIKRNYKIEVNPSDGQKLTLDKEIGVSRWAYNKFIEINQNRYLIQQSIFRHNVKFNQLKLPFVATGNTNYHYVGLIKQTIPYLNAYAFSKYFNHVYLPLHDEYQWIKSNYSKNIKQAFIDADKAYKNFFKNHKGYRYPRFRSRRRNEGSFYFVKNGKKQPIKHNRWQIKVPKMKEPLRFKTIGYLPKHADIISCRIKKKAGHYYLTAVVEKPIQNHSLTNQGIGIGLGIKNFAICSNGQIYRNLNKDRKVKKIRKQLKRVQRHFSRQLIAYRKRVKKYGKRNATDFNLAQTQLRMQRLYQRLSNLILDYQNKIISELVRTKPQYLAIEDLNIKGMMKNKHLAKAISYQAFYQFRAGLIAKCEELTIPVHLVKRIYASSKICHECKIKHSQLKLSDRSWKCDNCGITVNRDYNASLNIRDTEEYKIA